VAHRLVLGLGGTVDYEIDWDGCVIGSLAALHGITAGELDRTIPVVDERSLLVTLLAFVRDGAGGERFVASPDIVAAFASRFATRITLGGTCVRAAIALRSLGHDSLVHLVSIDDHVRRLLPDGVDYLCSATEDSTDPHLIVQFPSGPAVIGGPVPLEAPFPNRVIYTNDEPNRNLVISEDLDVALAEASVFLVSGFNTIQDPALLRARVDRVRDAIAAAPAETIVVYEDAGYHEPAFSQVVRDAIAPDVTVYSLNEEEFVAYVGRPVDLLDAADVGRALDVVLVLIPSPCVVVHTKHWALAAGPLAERFADAVLGGVVMASTRYLVGDGQTADDYARTASLPRTAAGVRFAAEVERLSDGAVRCHPAFVLDVDRPTTIGLGDTFIGGIIAVLADEVDTASETRSERPAETVEAV
jgi:sugar/nucleoside kinase (ribokinase family)